MAVRIYREWAVLATHRRRDLLVTELSRLSRKATCEQKQAKNREGAQRRAQSKIPPSWVLSDEQRAFIEDLWQDSAPEPVRPIAQRR
jgi:hypothetical protein